jgi:predicted phage terminase large subunit-like protein
MLATMFLAWLLGRDQKTQHVIASYGAGLSFKFHREVVGMLKTPTFKKIFPEWSGFSPDSKYDMNGGGYILATSVGGVLTGFTAGTTDMDSPGVGAMVIDDPLKSSDSKQALDNLETWWQEQASTRRTNHYCQLIIATRFHEKDLHGVLIEGDGIYDPDETGHPDKDDFRWRWINIAGLCEDPQSDPLERKAGESHWPSNPTFSVPMLESQRKIMGSFKFASLYQGMPKASEGQIVKNSWVRVIGKDEEPPSYDVTWIACDTAFQEREMSDETALCVASICLKDPTKIYIREIITGRWGFPDLIEAVKQAYSFYKAKLLCIEKAASGQSLIQVLKKEGKIPVVEMKPLKSKSTRLQAVTPYLESGRVFFLEDYWTEKFVKNLTTFPYVKHDDDVDSFTWALTYYAMSMDVVDRGLQEAIIQNKQYLGDLRREGLNDSTLFTQTSRGLSRSLPFGEARYNSVDYDSASDDDRSQSFGLRRGGGRGRIGYED